MGETKFQHYITQTCVVVAEPWLEMAKATHPRGPMVLWKSETFYWETLDQILGGQEPLVEQRPWMRQEASLV